MPCADISAMNDSNAKTELKKASQHHHQNQQRDACSPFCHCTCCAGFTVSHFPLQFTIIPIAASKQKSSFLPSAVIDITLPVWQPPQLV